MPRKPKSASKKIVVLCFDRAEEREINGFISHKRYLANEIDPGSGDELEAEIIYPGDVSNNDYMTFGSHLTPDLNEKKILQSLTPGDEIYVWGHGAPNYAYVPGAFYTEVANFIAAGINKESFTPANSLQIHCEMCNAGRGGPNGETSFSGRFHSYLGKKGIFATVTGRLRSVVVDSESILTKGLATVMREYSGLCALTGLSLTNFYKYKEPGSKATYQWELENGRYVQIRKDSYRITLNKLFIQFEKNLAKVLNHVDSTSKRVALRKCLLAVQLQINDENSALDKQKLSIAMRNLRTLLTRKTQFGLSQDQLTEMGLDAIEKRMMHHASGRGLVRKFTGVKMEDPLLPNERKSLVDVIKNNSFLNDLSRAAIEFRNNFCSGKPIDEKAQKFVQTIGSADGINENSLYANIFTTYRMHMIAKNDGHTTMPLYLQETCIATTSLLNKLNKDKHASQNDKKNYFKEYKVAIKKLLYLNLINMIGLYISGFITGFQVALKERHEGSLIESIVQSFKTGFEWARAAPANYEFFKSEAKKIYEEQTDLDSFTPKI